jgi:hypothetical protein
VRGTIKNSKLRGSKFVEAGGQTTKNSLNFSLRKIRKNYYAEALRGSNFVGGKKFPPSFIFQK